MGRSKRVLLVSGIYPPDVGGPASFVPQLRQHLLGQGWSVRVVAISGDDAHTDPGVRIVRRGTSPLIRRAQFARQFHSVASGCDVVFANGLHAEVGALARVSSKPWVAKVVGEPIWERQRNRGQTDLRLTEFHNSSIGPFSKLQRHLWIESLNTASSVIVPGPELENLLVGLGLETRLDLIPNGIPSMPFGPPVVDEPLFDVVTACRLTSWKGVDSLIDMAGRLGVRLLVIGDGPDAGALRKRASEVERGGGHVTFVGQLPQPEVKQHLVQSKIFALMSSYEGLSFALLEAKAAGLPAVASDIPGNRMVVRDGLDGTLVPLGDAQALDDAVTSMLQDEGERRAMGRAAQRDVEERFSLEATLTATERHLLEALPS